MKGKIREILNLNKKKQNRHTRNQTVPIEEEKHLGNETLSVGKQTKEDGKILAVKEATKVIIRISDVEGNKIAKISLGGDEADIELLCSMDNDGVSKSLLNEVARKDAKSQNILIVLSFGRLATLSELKNLRLKITNNDSENFGNRSIGASG